MKAAPAARAAASAGSAKLFVRRAQKKAISAAAAPLPPSPTTVARARSRRPVRSTLVAPMLPDPSLRISPAPPRRVMITPNGIDPKR